ncbi:hypothetical protein AbraIFM66950_001273 [Aspergillus brasiliensis]|nr:hypothetical protein AbraIFM66950_001273 [Aspergillus brasiliensis]
MVILALLRQLLCLGAITGVMAAPGTQHLDLVRRDGLLQNIVTWDNRSLMINGERLMIFSGEFHPFRLPSPGLWLDIFQKVKALGFNTVSFYANWALLEGKRGNFSAEGIFGFNDFFDAATEAGLYLIVRPGPYINAEASGGGFPGWMQRVPGNPRTDEPDYIAAAKSYLAEIAPILAKAQITRGGPIILVQPENEYSLVELDTNYTLSPAYMQTVEDSLRDAGIVVPFISNDASNYGLWAPGTGEGAVDIYGHDSYPVGLSCSDPYNWAASGSFIPEDYWAIHEKESPTTPYALMEFQGGSYDVWSGPGYNACAVLLNNEFERVFYKNDYSFGVKIFNVYMAFGGTNWGNLGFPEGYTSYDYGAAIKEDRSVWREKYSELKLQANFLAVSPAYLVAEPHNQTNQSQYANTNDLTVTAVTTNSTKFWVVRQTDYTSTQILNYQLHLPTSAGNLTIPYLGGSLTLNGRDSKIHVTDYAVGEHILLYSTAEIYTWQKYSSATVLVVYGGLGETHELAVKHISDLAVLEGPSPEVRHNSTLSILRWNVTTSRTIVKLDSIYIYCLDRNAAYDYWVLHLPGKTNNYSTTDSVIVKAGYLLRTAQIDGTTLALTGDINSSTTVEVIGTPSKLTKLTFNGRAVSESSTNSKTGALSGSVSYTRPSFTLPALSELDWRTVDALPELNATYDDKRWISANHTRTNNTETRNLTTPTSLYSSDYGFSAGSLLYRGHFTATGTESYLYLNVQGGDAFGFSAWVGDQYLGSYTGAYNVATKAQNYTLPALLPGKEYVFTVLQDHMGNEQNGHVYGDNSKRPRGILDYTVGGRNASEITWKLTGNLGGEDYHDRIRGPLNEGGLYPEREGWHLPNPPINKFSAGDPYTGISKAGVGFYFTSFDLAMPAGYDIPLEFVFPAWSKTQNPYRCVLYVNGYNFGRYLSTIGPQTAFHVPEGVLNYHGKNYIALSLWAQNRTGAALASFTLQPSYKVETGYGTVQLSPMSSYTPRAGAY